MPQADIFVGGDHVGAAEARQTADLLANYRITLVRHRRAAALFAAERLFGFADFSALQVANFDGDFFERGGDEGHGADIVRVAVALNDLRGDRSHIEAEALANALFDFRAKMRSIADGTGNFANAHLSSSIGEAFAVALI